MGRIRQHLRSRLLAGLVVLFPVGFTLWVLWLLFRWLDGLLSPVFDRALGFHLPGLGLGAVVVLVYLFGLVATNVIGRHLVRLLEALLLRTPIVRPVLLATKQVIETLRLPGRGAFQRVVLVQYPRAGLWALAFVTAETARQADGVPLLNLFLPTTPNPTSGMLVIVAADEVVELDMTVETGIRLVVSGGILSPPTYPVPPQDDGPRGPISAF